MRTRALLNTLLAPRLPLWYTQGTHDLRSVQRGYDRFRPRKPREEGGSVGRVIFLGTGDPLNEERAQACLAVPLADGETGLFDASSGTFLLPHLRAAGIVPTSVRHLFFTHRHFDHAGGLAPLL